MENKYTIKKCNLKKLKKKSKNEEDKKRRNYQLTLCKAANMVAISPFMSKIVLSTT